jgi:NitT/TauT family transport system substrate-binding protein
MAKKVIGGKLFGQTGDRNYDLLVSRTISNVSQLKGAIIGVSGINSADYVFLRATLAQYGISEKDVTYVTAGTIAERLTALSTGKIQAAADASAYRATELTVGNVLLKSEDNPLKVPTVVFWTNADYLKSHADVLKRFIGAVAQAAAWAKQPANQQATIAACEQGSGSTAEQCTQQIEFAKDVARASPYTWSATFAVNSPGIQEAINATALSIPEAKGLTLGDVVDSSIAGTRP